LNVALTQQVKDQVNSILQQLEADNAKYTSSNKKINTLVIGPQHSGKSSFINLFFKYFNPNWKVAVCDVGRTAQVGTVYYDKVKVGERNHQTFNFFDVAGKPFEQGLRPNDTNQLSKLLQGLPTSTNLIREEDWMRSKVEPENKIDSVVCVVSAELLVEDPLVLLLLLIAAILKQFPNK